MRRQAKKKIVYFFAMPLALLVLVVSFQNCMNGFEAKSFSSQLDLDVQPALKCEPTARQKVHKLTKNEYAATVKDLFSLANPPVSKVPDEEPGLSGFVNDTTYWQFSPQNVQGYLDNAALVMAEVMKTPNKLYSCAKGDACARATIQNWIEKIYRRPVTAAEVNTIVAVFDSNKAEGFDGALNFSFQAMLSSTSFLTRTYQDQTVGAGQIYTLNGYELANNLSYFIWGSMPDQSLFEDAKSGAILVDEIAAAHVRRMLKDPRSEALTKNFARYWLNLQKLASVKPDATLFPEWNENIRVSMEAEAEQFFRHIITEDLNIEALLTADYSFLNQSLASLYGVVGVTGNELRKVALPSGTQRAGIFTLGSTLVMNSASDHTRPVGRGLWILSKVMCSEPPSPPPNIPMLPNDGVDGESSIRQRLASHRVNVSCAGCHAAMDPIGLGLEIFSPIGKVRFKYRDGVTIDPTGELPGGRRFNSPTELREIIVAGNSFKACFTRHLSAYAIGRAMNGTADKCNARNIASEGAASGKKFSDLIISLVKSPMFKNRTGASQ